MTNVSGISALAPLDPQAGEKASKQKLDKTAHDFEALLVSQMLKSSRGEGGGWLGTGDDDSGDTAIGMGEEQLAQAMANGGGLGLARMIEAGLSKPPSGAK